MFDYIVAFDCVASEFLRLSSETVCSLATVFVSLKRYVKRKTCPMLLSIFSVSSLAVAFNFNVVLICLHVIFGVCDVMAINLPITNV